MAFAFNVDGFTSVIAARGLASPNKFIVKITNPTSVGADPELDIMCETISFAGRNVQTIMDLQYGLRREIAYNAPVYTPITLGFLCTDAYREKDYFDKWNNFIVDSNKGFDVAYYKHYTGTMTVTTLDRNGKKSNEMEYQDVYPKSVNSIVLNHSTQNSVARVSVEMIYSQWKTLRGVPKR